MAVLWPLTLPQYIEQDGFDYNIGDNLLRSETEAGPSKVRAKTTHTVDGINVTMLMTKAQWLIFLNYYKGDLATGTREFSFINPYSEVLEIFRMSGPPRMKPIGPLDVSVAMTWERLP